MSKLICEKSLPPNVNGRCRGTLKLKIHEINLRSTSSNRVEKSVGIQVKIIWWGESFQSGSTIK